MIRIHTNTFLITSLLLFLFTGHAQKNKKISSLSDLIIEIIDNRKGSDVTAYTFIQETIRLDSLQIPIDTTTWYEAIKYPDKFRIDFGNLKDGNMILYKNDQAYRYRDFKLDTTYYSPRDFLFMESSFAGYNNTQDVINRFKELGYDTNEFYELEEEGVYVIGASRGDLNKKQFWIDKKNFYVKRNIDILDSGSALDVHYSNFKNYDGFWIETKVTVYYKGVIRQIENYLKITTDVNFKSEFFDISEPFEWHWYTKN